MARFPFDEEKAISVVLYILEKLGGKCDRHKLFKILYYADQKHLVKYGRPVIGEEYVAMKNGPVPSFIYDGVKAVDNPDRYSFPLFFKNLKSSGYFLESKGSPDMDELSKSDIESIDNSIEDNKDLKFNELTIKSHSSAYNKACRNGLISMLNIAEEGGANKDMREYIRENSQESYC